MALNRHVISVNDAAAALGLATDKMKDTWQWTMTGGLLYDSSWWLMIALWWLIMHYCGLLVDLDGLWWLIDGWWWFVVVLWWLALLSSHESIFILHGLQFPSANHINTFPCWSTARHGSNNSDSVAVTPTAYLRLGTLVRRHLAVTVGSHNYTLTNLCLGIVSSNYQMSVSKPKLSIQSSGSGPFLSFGTGLGLSEVFCIMDWTTVDS